MRKHKIQFTSIAIGTLLAIAWLVAGCSEERSMVAIGNESILAAPEAASGHKDLLGCQAGPNEPTYTVDIGVMLGLPIPPGTIVEDLGACCVRGDYTSPTDNGFPGGCCKHPWIEPGPPNPAEHPRDRDNPSVEPPQVGHGCKCADAQALE